VGWGEVRPLSAAREAWTAYHFMAEDAKYKRFSFEAQKRNFSRCLPPTLACNEKPIRAHSIQNSRVIELSKATATY
jgi:hypothetical protein